MPWTDWDRSYWRRASVDPAIHVTEGHNVYWVPDQLKRWAGWVAGPLTQYYDVLLAFEDGPVVFSIMAMWRGAGVLQLATVCAMPMTPGEMIGPGEHWHRLDRDCASHDELRCRELQALLDLRNAGTPPAACTSRTGDGGELSPEQHVLSGAERSRSRRSER